MVKRHSQDALTDLAGEMALGGAVIVGIAAVATGAAIAALLRTSTEEKLRRLTPQEEWGEPIRTASCPYCNMQNEHRAWHCYACGQMIR